MIKEMTSMYIKKTNKKESNARTVMNQAVCSWLFAF